MIEENFSDVIARFKSASTTDLILRSPSAARASRRMAPGVISLVAVLRDGALQVPMSAIPDIGAPPQDEANR
jgi:hypothetical protein